MRVILPFVLNGQTLEKGKSFPKKVVAGSKDCLVVKVSGIPDGSVATAYFKQSWDNEKIYDLSFVGDECVIDEYITTLPSVVNEYVDYVVSFSVVVFGGDGQRLTTDPFKIVLNKSNYSDTTENTPEIPESQYVQFTREFADLKRGFNELGEKFDDLSNSVSNADVVYNKPTGTNLLDYDAVTVFTEAADMWDETPRTLITGYIPVQAGDVLSYQQTPDDAGSVVLTAGVVLNAYYYDSKWNELENESITTATFTAPDIDGVAYVRLILTGERNGLVWNPDGNLLEGIVRGAAAVDFAEFASVPYIRPDYLPDGVGGTDDAVLYTPQELTEEQKAQARENIGAVSEVVFCEKPNPYNVLDMDALTPGGLLPSGNFYNYNGDYTEYIPVTEGEVLTYQHGTAGTTTRKFYNIRYVCAFDANKKAVKSAGVDSGTMAYTVPNGIAFVRLTLQAVRALYQPAIVKSADIVPYAEYGAFRYFNPEYYNADDIKRVLGVTEQEAFPLNLPEKLYALVGEELNIYFDNLVDGHDTDYQFDATCPDPANPTSVDHSMGMQLERCFRFVPTAAGEYPITIKATNKDGGSVEKTATIYVADTTAGNGDTTTVIVLGDSTTDNGTAIAKLNENMNGDVMGVTTLGTRGTAPNNHEGRSGWRFEMYFKNANPFYNPDTKTFDAAYYFSNSGVSVPEWFFINLGINDVFNGVDDSGALSRITTAANYCDSVIASLKSYAPNIKIGVVLTIPPNYSQDAFGKKYGSRQTRNRYKRNNVMWVQEQIARYDGREDENIYLVPIHTNLDTKYNMGLEEIQHNKRNDTYKYYSPVSNGGVHPSTSGYWQIADVYWFFLKNNV